MEPLVLLTGGAGHLGSAILQALVAQGTRVRALLLPGQIPSQWMDERVEIFRGDVRDTACLNDFFNTNGQPFQVIHGAGIVSIASRYRQEVYDVNVGGTKNIVDACLRHEAQGLVYISSVHAIPDHIDGRVITEVGRFHSENVIGHYAKSKAMATQLVLNGAQAGLHASVVHPSGILGPYDLGRGHLTQMVVDYLKGHLTACIKGGYDFVDVRDVAAGVLACCQLGQAGECYILSNQFYEIIDVLNRLSQITGRKPLRTCLPLWFAQGSAPLAEAYYKILKQPPLYTSYSLYTLASKTHFSHEKATNELGYQTRPLEETLADTVAWLRQIGRVP